MRKRWDRNPDSCAPGDPQALCVDLDGGGTPRSENPMEVNTGSQSRPCSRDRDAAAETGRIPLAGGLLRASVSVSVKWRS